MPTRSKDHLPALDGLRGLAVLMVMYGHLPNFGGIDRAVRAAVAPHYLGVEIFFALSGFLITRILLVDFDRGGTLGQFYARRTLRIFPIYYLTLAVVAVFWSSRELGLWKYVLYVQNFVFAFNVDAGPPLSHTWSLAVEEQFYLAWPLIVLMCPRRWLGRVAIAGMLFGWIAMLIHASLSARGGAAATYFSPYRVPTLLAGAAIAIAEPLLLRRISRITLIAIVSLTTGVLVAGTARLMKDRLGDAPYIGGRVLGLSLVGIGLFALARRSADTGAGGFALLRRSLDWSTLRHVGRISYGIYLYHFPIYDALGIASTANAATFDTMTRAGRCVGAIALTFAIATASFVLIERPILRLKGRFAVGPEKRPDLAADERG
jgi:peptidoglycan/LPS O-acetylase OafA/YrhL